jgi:peptide-methionine (S)-S-oxide reductase
MFSLRKKLEIPSAADALPGRTSPIPTAPSHFLNGNALQGPYPVGSAKAMFGMGCFWGAERKFWELGEGICITAVGYAAGHTPNPTYQEVCTGRTGHNEVVLVVYDPAKISYERLLKTFWENHDPTQGMRQGNDVGTQYRSGIYVFDAAQRQAAEASKAMYEKALKEGPLRSDLDRDSRRADVLLRRGLSPAISGQEPGGLLRSRRHRGELPDSARVSRPPSEESLLLGALHVTPRALAKLTSSANARPGLAGAGPERGEGERVATM